jgi:hypothetical protein
MCHLDKGYIQRNKTGGTTRIDVENHHESPGTSKVNTIKTNHTSVINQSNS